MKKLLLPFFLLSSVLLSAESAVSARVEMRSFLKTFQILTSLAASHSPEMSGQLTAGGMALMLSPAAACFEMNDEIFSFLYPEANGAFGSCVVLRKKKNVGTDRVSGLLPRFRVFELKNDRAAVASSVRAFEILKKNPELCRWSGDSSDHAAFRIFLDFRSIRAMNFLPRILDRTVRREMREGELTDAKLRFLKCKEYGLTSLFSIFDRLSSFELEGGMADSMVKLAGKFVPEQGSAPGRIFSGDIPSSKNFGTAYPGFKGFADLALPDSPELKKAISDFIRDFCVEGGFSDSKRLDDIFLLIQSVTGRAFLAWSHPVPGKTVFKLSLALEPDTSEKIGKTLYAFPGAERLSSGIVRAFHHGSERIYFRLSGSLLTVCGGYTRGDAEAEKMILSKLPFPQKQELPRTVLSVFSRKDKTQPFVRLFTFRAGTDGSILADSLINTIPVM